MKISLNWLRELVDLSPDVSAEEVAAVLTRQGLEVEGIEQKGRDLSGLFVAEVLETRRHPKADKLQLVQILSGTRREEVVCGAPNVPAPGGKVVWAAPGATLPGGMKIEPREVRGILSPGMLCGESELGLSNDDHGLLILDADTPHGADVAQAIGARDDIFEVNVTPNRADALCHWGIARELSVFYGTQVNLPAVSGIPEVDSEAVPQVTVTEKDGCPRYLARTVVGLKNGPSPVWMRLRLSNCGIRSISRIVDVTNYVLLELGHPQHAFDFAKLSGGLVVRGARSAETIKTLDGQVRSLEPQDLLITDQSGPIAIAGVMGGADTEVTESTTTILLETATFEPRRVRRTAKRLGLSSEASYRFERGVNAESVPLAALRASSLLAQLAGGKLVRTAVDVYPTPPKTLTVTLSKSHLSRVSGRDFDLDTVRTQLSRLGFKCESQGDAVVATVPSHRSDVSIPEDLVEEVLRTGEYERPTDVRRIESNSNSMAHPEANADKLRFLLAGQGLSEIVTWAFVPRNQLHIISGAGNDSRLSDGIVVKNPISSDYEVMRTSLLPGLLTTAKRNISRGVESPWLFEVGPIIHRSTTGSMPPLQLMHGSGLLMGLHKGWLRPAENVDFYDAKRVMIEALASLGVLSPRFEPQSTIPYLHPGCAAQVIAKDPVGLLGQVHPVVAKKFGLEAPAYFFEIWIDALESSPRSSRAVSPPRFPASTRDISFWIDTAVTSEQQRTVIAQSNEPLLESLSVLEDYRDPRYVPEGKKGMLWGLSYRSTERTLTDAEVDQVHARVLAHLLAHLPVQIR